jgi:hypothetical protein
MLKKLQDVFDKPIMSDGHNTTRSLHFSLSFGQNKISHLQFESIPYQFMYKFTFIAMQNS